MLFAGAGYQQQAGSVQYASALLQSNQSLLSPQDPYGNVRIPRLEQSNGTADSDGWITVSEFSSPVQYASLVGVPVTADLPDGQANYSIEASYLNFTCDQGQILDDNSWTAWRSILGLIWANETYANKTPMDTSEDDVRSFFLDTYLRFDDDERLGELEGLSYNTSWTPDSLLNATRSIVWGSYVPAGLMYTNCSVTYVHVEASVNCSSPRACAVSRIRPSQQDVRSIQATAFDIGTISSNFFDLFPLATGHNSQSGQSSPTEVFMSTLSSPFTSAAQRMAEQEFVDLLTLSATDFSARLSLVMSTYWQVSFGAVTYNGGIPPGAAVANTDWSDQSKVEGANDNSFIALSTTAQTTTTQRIWVCNFLWLALLLTSSIVVLLLGVVGMILKLRLKAPDMLGFVNSLTYDNQYVPLDAGCTVDGMDRTRFLYDLKVRVGDVCGTERVGHVAFAAAKSDVVGLSRSRLYV